MSLEAVDHPKHYDRGNPELEPIKVIQSLHNINVAGFCFGNVIKYISRAELKGNPIQDYDKALWYLKYAQENNTHTLPELYVSEKISNDSLISSALHYWKLDERLEAALTFLVRHIGSGGRNKEELDKAVFMLDVFVTARKEEEMKLKSFENIVKTTKKLDGRRISPFHYTPGYSYDEWYSWLYIVEKVKSIYRRIENVFIKGTK
jgi:hypothetical protein